MFIIEYTLRGIEIVVEIISTYENFDNFIRKQINRFSSSDVGNY